LIERMILHKFSLIHYLLQLQLRCNVVV